MPSEWRETTLGEVCETVTDGAHASPASVDDGMPMASVKDLTRYGIALSGCRRISRRDFDKLVRDGCQPRCGDVLMAKDGASCLETVCVFDQPDELVLLSSVAIFRPSPSLDAHFLRYYLEWPQTKALLRGGYVSGSAIPRVVLRDFKAAPVPLPPLPTQLAIARVLGALDDKIELDRKMNETLEQMARAIFKSWFVDFEPFRDKGMVDSSLGKIPKGWEVKALGEVAERVAMGPFGSSIKVDTFVVEGIPVISGQHLWGIMLNDLNYNFVTPEHADKLSNANVYRGDVVFTHAGSIGQVAWIPESSKYERYVISQRQFYMRCDLAKVCPSYVVYYFSSPEGQHKLLANTSSSGVPSISRPVTYLRSIQMPVPPRRVLEEFEGAVRPVHLQMRSQVAQSRTLAAIRDALLPKLMSGEVRVETRTA